MKKLVSVIMTAVLCLGMSISTFAAIPSGWREISDEELGLPSEEEEIAITEAERNRYKAVTDDMYAALFGTDHGNIDCTIDVDIADKYFSAMKYNTEPYKEPLYSTIHRIYYCTDILMFAGHGSYDRVNMKPAPEFRTDANCTGVYMGTSNITDGDSTLVGIGKKSMNQCRFAMFAACLTADETKSTNIAKYAVENSDADASIGWKVYVSSTGIQNWEGFFFSYIEQGYTLNEAKQYADALTTNSTARQGILYGNKNLRLSKNRSRSADDIFISIDEMLDIDCASKDFDALTDYLNRNVDGFDTETWEIELVENYADGEYEVVYNKIMNGFKTPYSVIVFVSDDEGIKYYSNFDAAALEDVAVTMSDDDVANSEVAAAKAEAINEYEGCVVVEQIVEKQLDENMRQVLNVMTVYEDEAGTYFAEDYVYYLQ